jgi:hypothetical protein
MSKLRHGKRGTAMFRHTNQELDGDLTIRRLGADDAGALERLAQRDSAHVPAGTVSAAVSAEGSILAAISLESGALVADPFLPTSHQAKLLRVWARELGDASRPRWLRGGMAVAAPQAAASHPPAPA